MNLIFILVAALISTCQTAETDAETERPDVPESLNVAKNFRKALIEALENLEKDENSTDDPADDLDASDFDETGRMQFGHKIRQNVSKQEAVITSFTNADKANVFVHSFSSSDTSTKPKESKKILDKTNKIEATTSKFRNKITTDNALSASATSTVSGNNKILLKPTKKETSTAPITPATALTSPNPTVSTPAEEEEDDSKQKAEEVQFIHAPLVAAFTVEQDDKGLPRKVIPIYGNKQTANNNQLTSQNSINNFQASLEEKQRQLEQQIRQLQEQRRQHELLLLQQQALQRQQLPQNIQRQNFFQQSFISEQKPSTVQNDFNSFRSQNFQQTISNDQQNRLNIPIPLQTNLKSSTTRPTKEVSGTVVAFQPSIVFQPNSFNQIQKPTDNQFTQSFTKPLTQLNQEISQKSTSQFNQGLTQFQQNQNSINHFDQIHHNLPDFIQNPPTQFTQSITQTPSSDFINSVSLTQPSQFSQSITQKPSTEFINSLSLTQPSQFTPSLTQNIPNQFNSPGKFNQGFITPTINLNQALPQQTRTTQFNSGLNNGRLNQGLTQNQNPSLQFNKLQFNQNQALPVKSAVEFQKAISVPISNPVNNVNQQQFPNQFRDNSFNNGNYLQEFLHRQRTLIPPPPRSNRFNRHETQVGNFGINNFSQNQNQFQQNQQFQQSQQFQQNHFQQNQQFQQKFNQLNLNNNNNQPFRPNQFIPEQRNNFDQLHNRQIANNQFFNSQVRQTNVDNRLKNLIHQSGLGQGRTQEDLNIVSKVLALDHTGNYQQNLLFGASNVSERRIPFSQLKKPYKT